MENEWVLVGVMMVIFLPVFFMMAFIPYFTRRTESFGISVPADVYDEQRLKEMRKKYALRTSLLGVLMLPLFVISGFFLEEGSFPWMIIPLLLFISGSVLMYLPFHFQMKQIKAKERWEEERPQTVVVDTEFRRKKLTYSNGWFIFGFLISICTAFVSLSLYDQIPAQIPMQYDVAGNVTNTVHKSYASVLFMPFVQLVLTGLFLVINTMIAKSKQQIDPANPKQSIEQNLVFRRRWSLFTIIGGNTLVLAFSFISLSFTGFIEDNWAVSVTIVHAIALVMGAIVLTVTTGQGGSRVRATVKRTNEEISRDDDQYWKLGQIYVNADDPAIFVEKRFGVGWTVNFARPMAWVFLIGPIVLILIPLLLLT